MIRVFCISSWASVGSWRQVLLTPTAAVVPVYHYVVVVGFFFCLRCKADNRKRYKEEENDHLDDQTAADLAWSKHKLLNESIIVALFQGQFKSTVQCLTCHRKSRTFETFMYLSLPLASTSKCSLQVSQTVNMCITVCVRILLCF